MDQIHLGPLYGAQGPEISEIEIFEISDSIFWRNFKNFNF